MKFLCTKTENEPHIYRNPRELKNGGHEVTLPNGVKVKYRRGECEVFATASEARVWLSDATQERLLTLRNRLKQIEAEYLKMDKELGGL